MKALHYYECHVTIDPVFGEDLEKVKYVASFYGFKVASLLMEKGPNKKDSFMTAHHKQYNFLVGRLIALVNELRGHGFIVQRYKIEDILLDSRIEDELGLLK